MKRRSDSQVFFKKDVPIENLDKYIARQQKEGVKVSYMNAVVAGVVRLMKERPQLNRFAINGVLYQRNDITVPFVLKKDMTDDAEEISVKMKFTGDETIFDVKEALSGEIHANKGDGGENDADDLVKALSHMPDFLLNIFIGSLKVLDKHGLLPKAIIELSPFHSSCCFVNIASLGLDAIYHHIYDFGTTSMFICMGQTKIVDVADADTGKPKKTKCLSLSFVCDERICDGFYYTKSFQIFSDYLQHPEMLEK
jgi:hypothetical protein